MSSLSSSRQHHKMSTIHITEETPNPLKLEAGEYLLVYPDGMKQKEHVQFGSVRNIWFKEEEDERFPMPGVKGVCKD
jgi:hypothetical protein